LVKAFSKPEVLKKPQLLILFHLKDKQGLFHKKKYCKKNKKKFDSLKIRCYSEL